jgi:hypothetical protein
MVLIPKEKVYKKTRKGRKQNHLEKIHKLSGFGLKIFYS